MTRIGVETLSAGACFGASAGGMIVYYQGLIGELRRRVSPGSLVVIANNRDLVTGDLDANPDVVRCHGIPSTRVGRIAYEQLAPAQRVPPATNAVAEQHDHEDQPAEERWHRPRCRSCGSSALILCETAPPPVIDSS